MKKFYMTIVAMLCGVAAMAQEGTCTISAADFEATAGEIAYMEFILNEEPTGLIETFSLEFDLPEGAASIWYDADEEDYMSDATCPIKKNGHTVGLLQSENNPQHYLFSVMSANATFKTSEPRVAAKIAVNVSSDMVNDTYDIPVTPKFSHNGASAYPQDPFVVKMTVVGGTGINSINADDVNAPIYNIAGQRVSKAQKGVYIQNGKKVAVK